MSGPVRNRRAYDDVLGHVAARRPQAPGGRAPARPPVGSPPRRWS